MKSSIRLILSALLLTAPLARAANDSLVTAVHSSVHNGYFRATLPDGSFKREYYAITNGTYLPGATPDRSIDAVRYPQIAKLVAQFLALKNYYPAQGDQPADFVLKITWGTTVPYDDASHRTHLDSYSSATNSLAAANAIVRQSEEKHQRQSSNDGIQTPIRSVRDEQRNAFEGELLQMEMFNDVRLDANERNARLLGYSDEINQRATPAQFAGAGALLDDLFSDIESERYFVIISASDFHAAKEENKDKLLWVTRVSVQAQGNKFNETLAAMLARASRYFGQNSGQLVRQYQREGKVTFGDLKVVGYVPNAENEENSPGQKNK